MNLSKEPSDPKLLEAMEKIKAVLNEYDIAGITLLQSQTHGEWLNHISPSWSAARLINDEKGVGIHFKALVKDYPSKEAHKQAMEETVGMLCCFRDGADRISRNMEQVLEMLSKKFSIEHISKFNR